MKINKLITLTLFSSFCVAQAGILCNPALNTDCKPVIEYMPVKVNGKELKAMPVVIAYIDDVAKQIVIKSSYSSLRDLENSLDKQVINQVSKITADSDYMKFLREIGEQFNNIELRFKIDLSGQESGTITYIYRNVILPSGSFFVLRKVKTGDFLSTNLNVDSLDYDVKITNQYSPVVLKGGIDFWRDYINYYKAEKSAGRTPENPEEFWKRWKKLPSKLQTVKLPPVFIIKNKKIYSLRGKTIYRIGEIKDWILETVKTVEDFSAKDGTVIPKGTLLKTVYQSFLAESNPDRQEFFIEVIAKTLLDYYPDVFSVFDFQNGYAYITDEDGNSKYRIVYAGTPVVLKYIQDNDVHYTQYGMDNPMVIYWNEPLKNSIVVPERIACLYFTKNCSRFSVYKPVAVHPATDELTRDYLKEIGQKSDSTFSLIKKAIFSQKISGLGSSLESSLNNIKIATAEESLFKECVSGSVIYKFVVPKEFKRFIRTEKEDSEGYLSVSTEYLIQTEESCGEVR